MKYELLLNLAEEWDHVTSDIKFFTRGPPSSLLEGVFHLFSVYLKTGLVKQTQVCQLTRRNNPNLGFMGCFGLFNWQGESVAISFLTTGQCIHSGLSEVSGYFQSAPRLLLAREDLFQCYILLAT